MTASRVDQLLDCYVGADLRVEARWATWELTVFEVMPSAHDPLFVAVRRSHLDEFLAALWSGALDQRLLSDATSTTVRRRRLSDGDHVQAVVAVGAVVDPTRLPPAERDRQTGRIGHDPPRGRRHKREQQESSRRPPRPRRAWLAGAVAGVVVLGAVAAAVTGGDGDQQLVSGGGPDLTLPTFDPDSPSTTGPGTLSFQGTYLLTGVIEEYEETDAGFGGSSHYGYAVGQTVTVALHCGSFLVETGERECSPDPSVPVTIDGVPDDSSSGTVPPVFGFSVEDLIDGDRAEIEGTACEASNYEPDQVIEMDGYGTETISGTYRHTYPQLQCETEDGGLYLVFNIVMRFTGVVTDGGMIEISPPPDGFVEGGS